MWFLDMDGLWSGLEHGRATVRVKLKTFIRVGKPDVYGISKAISTDCTKTDTELYCYMNKKGISYLKKRYTNG